MNSKRKLWTVDLFYICKVASGLWGDLPPLTFTEREKRETVFQTISWIQNFCPKLIQTVHVLKLLCLKQSLQCCVFQRVEKQSVFLKIARTHFQPIKLKRWQLNLKAKVKWKATLAKKQNLYRSVHASKIPIRVFQNSSNIFFCSESVSINYFILWQPLEVHIKTF